MLAAATSIADSALRMEKLAACEEKLLRAMPLIPLYFDTWVYLERPEVHGLKLNLLGLPGFKYAWIDTSWRPDDDPANHSPRACSQLLRWRSPLVVKPKKPTSGKRIRHGDSVSFT